MTTAPSRFIAFALAAAALSAATGAAFAAWGEHGAAIFMAMASGGLAWCF